jgi:hypothetical protein
MKSSYRFTGWVLAIWLGLAASFGPPTAVATAESADQCPTIEGYQPVRVPCVPPSQPIAKVHVWCVTKRSGKGIVRLGNKGGLQEAFWIFGAGVDRIVYVKVGAHKRIVLRDLTVGQTVYVVAHGKVLDKAWVKQRPRCR